MTRSKFLFVAIDYLFHPIQNYKRYKGMIREKDFSYDEDYKDECRAEFYYCPETIKSGKKLPVVLNIHGGGFVAGDKMHRRSLCKRYASKGYFVYNINHRLGPKYKFPEGIRDCIKAFNYLKNFAEKYNLDLNKIAVTGDSAGAYYATLMVAVANNDELRESLGCEKMDYKPACLVSFCGPYDLIASITLTKLPFNLLWDMGQCLFDNENFKLEKDFSNIHEYELMREASPIEWVNENWCPAFLVMSEKDIFCKGQGELLEKKLKEAGVRVDTFKSKKIIDNHCFHLDMYKSISKECFKKAFQFMNSILKN